MRYLILSDIHANREALEAVEAATAGRYDQLVCLGDIVGYGPDPAFAIEWLRARPCPIVRGNHDKAVVDPTRLEWFNPIAKSAARWTTSVLTDADVAWLGELPQGPLEVDDFRICHGSPANEDEYLSNRLDVAPLFDHGTANGGLDSPGTLFFFGHTHIQGGFNGTRSAKRWKVGLLEGVGKRSSQMDLRLARTASYLVNPGAVGQPRDSDPRAAYCFYDSDARTVTYERVGYDIERVQRKIIDASLPMQLAMRLAIGR